MYVFGVAGLAAKLDKSATEALALVTAFIPGDVVKAVIAGLLTSALAKARPASVLSRS
jgi:biotin transport system substrate-specific component